MNGYLRGQLAKLADVNMETLRYYEKNGLIPLPSRSDAGYRIYPKEVLGRLIFIKNAKACGFTLKEIRKALDKSGEGGPGAIRVEDFIGVIDRKLAELDREIAELERTKEALAGLRGNLLAAERHPGVRDTLRILQMEE
ncbi:MerR family transcriptional regulator [Gorillibacterium sp. sgz5001074]|uniref:MerR family transcriptional regulator n=1 Tax=Gorillibacterium sp. sgz5001074 TaxID=3446695 RepID=UPI003F675741